jgi:hypothetical protein
MAGNKAGGKAAARTNKALYGEDFYIRMGAKGGKSSRKGGFASKVVGADGLTGSQRASKWGTIGGSISRRRKNG